MPNFNHFLLPMLVLGSRAKTIGNSLIMLLTLSVSNTAISSQTSNSPPLKIVGQATAYWAKWIPIYDATLSVGDKTNLKNLLSDKTAVELELCYRRELTADNFIDAANEALPKNLSPSILKAVKKLHQSYESVKSSDCYQLSYHPLTGTQLKLNHQLKFVDQTPGFKAAYFGIWLGENPLSDQVKSNLTAAL